ncbi:glycosyltransferase [Thioalkalivibrio sp.]|uniref:glycosyltransferase n=1 Tax=Thioalkalivibrio sp. TaxID=2093813 RepID=UPI0012D61401|nr:glycosyltransferase [Thioalkalivibrio sp.]TVP83802.1 MAG: glycosyltransferase [Thioalkalivibrio sp.]
MQTLPRITVVTPAFRSAATIAQTIRSIVSQDYDNFEYFVVDGAGDDTRRILQEHDRHITWWSSEPDDGQYDAICKGFHRATGEILFWLNADDMLLPGALRIVGEVFAQNPGIEWLSSLAPGHFDAAGYYSGHGAIPGFSHAAFLDGYFLPGIANRGQWIQQESTFFRKSLWDKVARPFDGVRLAGDFALWCDFQRHAELVGLTYPVSGFRHIAGQRSEDMAAYMAEARPALEALREHFDWAEPMSARRLLRTWPFRRKAKSTQRVRPSYTGKRVERARMRDPDAHWALGEHVWLP